jgi:hypothetical protein
MLSPTVTETRLHLEPCSRDTFIADLEPHREGPWGPAAASGSKTPEGTR